MDAPLDPVPDAITPLTGYRMWRVVLEGGEPRFLPLNMPTPEWNGAESGWVSASCLHGQPASVGPAGSLVVWPGGRRVDRLSFRAEHHVPEEACSCGFYALKELDPNLLITARAGLPRAEATDGSEQHVVIGRVELAGKVIEHERGYRAERARIVELIPVRGSAAPVRDLAKRLGLSLAPTAKAAPRVLQVRDRWGFVRANWAATRAARPTKDDGGALSGFSWVVGLLAYFAAFATVPSNPWGSGWRLAWVGCLILRGFAPSLRDAIRSLRM
jgi:hypothetical protein